MNETVETRHHQLKLEYCTSLVGRADSVIASNRGQSVLWAGQIRFVLLHVQRVTVVKVYQ
jgi:hypothetical protein